jgi:DNA-binding Lrp family transcriptional regulator
LGMKGSGNEIVDMVGRISITGNIIPQIWYKTITHPSGKPYLEAIVILSDIVYWYRPTEVRDERTGEVIAYRKRFKADLLQRSYADLAQQFGISKREATNAVVALEKIGVVRRHLRTIDVNGTKMANVLFLELVPKALLALTCGEVTPITFKSDTSHVQKGDLSRSEVTPLTFKSETNTENTTENTTETSTRDRATVTAPAKAAPEKKGTYGCYGNVKLSDTDLSKLKAEFPADWQERIDRLSTYMDSSGKSYKNHLATIRNWARRDAERGMTPKAQVQAQSTAPARPEMSIDDIMEKHGVDYMTAMEMHFDGTY